MGTSISVLSNVNVVNLDIHLWTGRKKMRDSDFPSTRDLPPEDLATLGSKKICDPTALKVFGTLKKQAITACEEIGVKFLSGYAVPLDKSEALAQRLNAIGSKFEDEKLAFITSYNSNVAAWIARHHEWERAIREAITPVSEVDAQLQYGYQMFRVQAASDAVDAVQNESLKKTAGGLAGQLFKEIADAADQVMEKSLMGRDAVTTRIFSPIRTIRSKLDGLSFIAPCVAPLVETIDCVLARLPQSGPITGVDLSALHGLIFMLSNPERMQKHGEMIIQGNASVEDLIDSVDQIQTEALLDKLSDDELPLWNDVAHAAKSSQYENVTAARQRIVIDF